MPLINYSTQGKTMLNKFTTSAQLISGLLQPSRPLNVWALDSYTRITTSNGGRVVRGKFNRFDVAIGGLNKEDVTLGCWYWLNAGAKAIRPPILREAPFDDKYIYCTNGDFEAILTPMNGSKLNKVIIRPIPKVATVTSDGVQFNNEMWNEKELQQTYDDALSVHLAESICEWKYTPPDVIIPKVSKVKDDKSDTPKLNEVEQEKEKVEPKFADNAEDIANELNGTSNNWSDSNKFKSTFDGEWGDFNAHSLINPEMLGEKILTGSWVYEPAIISTDELKTYSPLKSTGYAGNAYDRICARAIEDLRKSIGTMLQFPSSACRIHSSAGGVALISYENNGFRLHVKNSGYHEETNRLTPVVNTLFWIYDQWMSSSDHSTNPMLINQFHNSDHLVIQNGGVQSKYNKVMVINCKSEQLLSPALASVTVSSMMNPKIYTKDGLLVMVVSGDSMHVYSHPAMAGTWFNKLLPENTAIKFIDPNEKPNAQFNMGGSFMGGMYTDRFPKMKPHPDSPMGFGMHVTDEERFREVRQLLLGIACSSLNILNRNTAKALINIIDIPRQ